jgi:hypothetical protein
MYSQDFGRSTLGSLLIPTKSITQGGYGRARFYLELTIFRPNALDITQGQ